MNFRARRLLIRCRCRRWIHEHRRDLAVVAAVICGLAFAAAAHFQSQTNSRVSKRLSSVQKVERRVGSRLAHDEKATIDACERLNQQIVTGNRQSLALYDVLKLTLVVNEVSVRGGQVPASYRKYIEPTLVTLRQGVNAQSWTPPTPCVHVIRRVGSHYKLAPPVEFAKRMPPAKALKFKQPPVQPIKTPAKHHRRKHHAKHHKRRHRHHHKRHR